ncbi:hypothetical protein LTR28_010244, partial [Elasticomyces elasticus]
IAWVEQSFRDVIRAVQWVVEEHCGLGWDGTLLAVALPAHIGAGTDERFDVAAYDKDAIDAGFEVIDSEATGRNEFGERVGMERLKEVLETTDWEGTGLDDEDDVGDLGGPSGLEEAMGDFDDEEAEMSEELWGMKGALLRDDGDEEDEDAEGGALQVEQLSAMMGRLQAIKGSGREL